MADHTNDTSHGNLQAAGRRRLEPVQVIDELAQESKRVSLLERLEYQLRDTPLHSRILFTFGISDDKKIQGQVDQEFEHWMATNEYRTGPESLSGVLVYMGQSGIHFLEGSSKAIFDALQFFNGLAQDAPAKSVQEHGGGIISGRTRCIYTLRILHFTELHGVRYSTSWCSFVHASKLVGNPEAPTNETAAAMCYVVYRKFLKCFSEISVREGTDARRMQEIYKQRQDLLPVADDIQPLVKSGNEFFFTYAEFEKVFIAPFQLVLHSELLWPMPPQLSY